MSRLSTPLRAALSVAALLASLSFVAWRQGRALQELTELERIRNEISLARAEQAALVRRIQYLESRGRVVPEAAERLGLHNPVASEQVLLSGESH